VIVLDSLKNLITRSGERLASRPDDPNKGMTDWLGTLENSEKYFRSMVQTATDAVVTIDGDGIIIFWNRAAEKIFGYSAEEVLGRSITLMLPERFRQAYQKSKLKHATSGRDARIIGGTHEAVAVRKDGSQCPVEVSVSSWAVNGKNYFTGIFRDITARKNVDVGEEEVILAAVRDISARKQAERMERLATLGSMAAEFVHEINQPLNALKVTVDIMLYWFERGRDLSRDKIMEDLQKISRQAERIGDIVRYVRLLTNRKMPAIAPCDINKVVKDAVNILGNELVSRGIELKLLLADIPLVKNNEERLMTVVSNLIVNAVQAFENAAREKKQIVCATRAMDDRAILQVSDNAAGISEQLSEKIFDPFFTTKQSGESMGLGLAIVRHIVTSCKGEIKVYNNNEGGATFEVAIPINT